ncbi:Probable lipoprotein precursor, SusD/RagB family [Tenacibaculum litopenaei]|uniref:SusD/RagB family nutrient-binding outer membrane lipoprotein n=1 Tax=Tenacibaculum litopenaei TaxID=396016 RepID=UPI003893C951
MRKIIKMTVMLLSLAACENADFGDAVINPNEPSVAIASAFLGSGQLALGNIYSEARPSLYVQYLANEQYNSMSLYRTQRFDYVNYYHAITNLLKVIALNTNPKTKEKSSLYGSNNNQIAVARLVRAFYFQFMTDNWGMLPYSTANDLSVEFNKFDTQETIYRSLFKEIEEAILQIDHGAGPTGDIILKGDMRKWRLFGYSLMMNMAVRLSHKAPSLGKMYYQKALNGGVIFSNNDNFYFPYLEDENHDNPWQDRFQTRSDYLLSDTFVNALIGKGTNVAPEDPRLEKFGEKAVSTHVYNGAPYGAINSRTNTFSFITKSVIYNQRAKGYLLTAAQMYFNAAEAAHYGWDQRHTAAYYYEQGIRASMEQWGVSQADIVRYLQKRPAFIGMRSIAYEKWVALFLQGYEAWFDWRKQGEFQVPLKKPVAAITKGIPNRQAYPLSAISANEANYRKALALQGPDNLDTKVWWAK